MDKLFAFPACLASHSMLQTHLHSCSDGDSKSHLCFSPSGFSFQSSDIHVPCWKKNDFPWGYPERMLEKAMTGQPVEQKSKMSPCWFSQDSCRSHGAGQPALVVQSHSYLSVSSWDRGAEDPRASTRALSAITCSLSLGWQHRAWTGGLEAHRGAWLWNNINLESNSELLSSGHTFLLCAWFLICCFNFVCLFVFLSSKVL